MLRRDRNWVILRLAAPAHDNVWVQFTAMVAPTAKAAVLKATKDGLDLYRTGTFIAIPGEVWAKQIKLDGN